jgi:Protein of unknown function (DUF3662)/FHA domain
MGVLDRFEKGIERAVNSAFAKAFRSEVQPVEVASALCRECDDRVAVVGRGRSLVPNSFVVELSESDFGRVGEWQDALADELQAVVSDHAAQQGYSFVGAVQVSFEHADDLDTGVFRVRSSMTRPPTHAGHAVLLDLDSTNGTFVDGERVRSAPLTDGSQITMGRTRIVYRLGRW